MARRNYLVEGLSGAGKSSVYDELIRRGYPAVSTDRAWKHGAGPSLWNEQKALGEVTSPEPDVLFACGSSRNRDRFLPHFTKVFNLRIDDATMRRRLRERTNNDFGKQPEELELMLELNREGAKPAGAIDVDATQPLAHVVDDVLRLAGCNAPPASPPWSRRGSTAARSFVIPEAALGRVPATESRASLEYLWSGDLLAMVLAHLGEQGIDLGSDAAGSTYVLTADHRDRYLALLDPAAFDGTMLRRRYEELTGTTAAHVQYAMLDAIAFLRDTLEAVGPPLVAVLVLG